MYHIAHRGHSYMHKDNTLESFISALNSNFHMIELDIQLTKDNRIIIFHDTFINDKLICSLYYNEIIEYDKDILTIEQFFININHEKIGVYLDIKGSSFICIYLHNFLKTLNNVDKILIGSFNFVILEDLYKLDYRYNLGLITENVFNNECLQYYIDTLNIAFVCYHWSVLTNKSITHLHNNDILVFTYTCKNKDIEKLMREYDIDGIVSNYKL